MRNHLPLAALIVVFLIVGSLFALNTPDWQAPDEPAHYNYIRQLAGGSLPVIEPNDYDQAYQSRVISSRFDPQYSVLSFEYEDYQPPLYYLLATPLYWLFDGALKPIRLLSLVLGAAVVVLTYFIALRIFPGRVWLALAAAVFVAFLPQHMAMLSSVNNDSLAELLIAGILFLLIGIARQQSIHNGSGNEDGESKLSVTNSEDGSIGETPAVDRRILVGIGILLGLGFITKVTVYIMVPVVAIALLWIYWGDWRELIKAGLYLFVPAFVIGIGWWIRNMVVYGDLDALGTQAHNAIVVGQPRTAEWIAERGLTDTLRAFFQTTFQSFWGQFGWMGVVMPGRIYTLLLLFTLITTGGLVWALIRRDDRRDLAEAGGEADSKPNWPLIIVILAGTFGLSLMVFLGYNLTFVQHQGRYLFSALIPISIAVVLAWGMLIWPFADRWPPVAYLLPCGLALALVGLDLLALYRYIIPALAW